MSVRSWIQRRVDSYTTGESAWRGGPAGSMPLSSELVLFRSTAGRLFILSGLLLLVLEILKRSTLIPAAGATAELLELFHKVVALALIGSGGWLFFVLLIRNRRRFLWRIRRKLILSYLCLGLVPATLIAAFTLAGGAVLYNNVAAYLFHQGFEDVVNEVHQIADTAAIEIGRNAGRAQAVLETRSENLSSRYPKLSLAVVSASKGTEAIAGPWDHGKPPGIPSWVVTRGGFQGALARTPAAPTPEQRADAQVPGTLLIRAVSPTRDPDTFVVADLPVDDRILVQIDEHTGTKGGKVVVSLGDQLGAPEIGGPAPVIEEETSGAFRNSVAFLEFSEWDSGRPGRVQVGLVAPAMQLYQRMVRASQLSSASGGIDIFKGVLIALGVVFAIVQGAFLVAGVGLARMITYAVHELFVGTERVRQGDFTHRIRVDSEDQLGDLADSFNRMSGSIEHLLHVQREKQRLDDELRIAREIQKSLLPVHPPVIEGLSIADLCEPAREVGGDYYDFFLLAPRQLGVLIADVSGKGTSAALYMAELKGLMLALSHTERSPRNLLVTVNHLLAEHLDNRSFITATYIVIDLDAMTMTCARAGHTPLIVASGSNADLVAPEGMVLGLRLPGAEERFSELLQEHTRPLLSGDVIVLYTDGITEAMDAAGELFGETALQRIATSHSDLDARGLRERVLREVRAFVGDAEPHDDMTMVILKVA